MTIGKIIWAANPAQAVRSYIAFQLKVLKALGIVLPKTPNDPIVITDLWLKGQLTEQDFSSARDEWWDLIDTRGWLQEFEDKDALLSRLSLCLLAVKESDASILGEHLSWFFEVLNLLGADAQKAISLMKQEFKFSEA